MENAFLLGSGAFILLPDIPTYKIITQIFNVCNHDQHETTKMLTLASQSEVPIQQCISVTCFSSIETSLGNFNITLVEAGFKQKPSRDTIHWEIHLKLKHSTFYHEFQTFVPSSTHNCLFYHTHRKEFSFLFICFSNHFNKVNFYETQ